MDHFELANQPKEDLKDIFSLISEDKGLPTALIEKDFWVTVILKYLFTVSPWKEQLLFKGGTCLSKCHHAIKRFSEDIDLVVDWRKLGYPADGPRIGDSRKQKEKINEELIGRSDTFLKEEFIPTMEEDLSKILSCDFSIEYESVGNVIFKYPVLYRTGYVKSEILIEIGPRGTWKDSVTMPIKSYISEELSELCNESIDVLTTSLERVYCEKLLILHTNAFKKRINERYSRHYYDVYSIHDKVDRDKVMVIIDDAVSFKQRFFPGNYGYDSMKKGSFSFKINEEMIDEFRRDYESMKEMIFEENVPSVDDIIKFLKDTEYEINQ